jgi:hypothetical protein
MSHITDHWDDCVDMDDQYSDADEEENEFLLAKEERED